MPQMKPMYWLFMLIFIFFYMISIISFNYFTYLNLKTFSNLNKDFDNYWIWKW